MKIDGKILDIEGEEEEAYLYKLYEVMHGDKNDEEGLEDFKEEGGLAWDLGPDANHGNKCLAFSAEEGGKKKTYGLRDYTCYLHV